MDILPQLRCFMEMTAPHTLLQNRYTLLNTLNFHDGNLIH